MTVKTPRLHGLPIKRSFSSGYIVPALLIFTPVFTSAQTPTPSFFVTTTPVAVTPSGATILKIEGIGGDVDRDDRGPRITYSVDVQANGATRILVNGEVPNEEYRKYPIQYDFFINNRLFSSQVTSVQLPGPIGIDVGPDKAPLPFNYTIKATVLHPNRSFTTMAFGAVDESMIVTPTTPTPEPTSIATPGTGGNGTSSLHCTVSYDKAGAMNFTDFTNNNVPISQSGSLISASFSAASSDGTSSIAVDIAVTAGTASADKTRPLSGTVQVKTKDATDNITIDGEVGYDGNNIADFTVGDPGANKLDVICGTGNLSGARRLADRLGG